MLGAAISGDVALDLVNANFVSGGHPPHIPPRTLTVGLQAENASWTARIEAVDTEEQDRLDTFETPTDGFTFLNAGLTWRPQGREGAWTVRLDGRNLRMSWGTCRSWRICPCLTEISE
jgi:iron complex outermembrane receptor protein